MVRLTDDGEFKFSVTSNGDAFAHRAPPMLSSGRCKGISLS